MNRIIKEEWKEEDALGLQLFYDYTFMIFFFCIAFKIRSILAGLWFILSYSSFIMRLVTYELSASGYLTE